MSTYDRSCYLVNVELEAGNQRSRPQRQPRADGERTRAAILRTAASLATVDGLEGLSIGNLAAATGISKSGLYAHFGSKQELQLATVEEAERILDTEVIQPALAARPGLAQLAAACEAFFSYVERRVFPGGCFFAATALEMGTHAGPVKERVAAIQSDFTALLRAFAVTALEQHELPGHEDPDRLAFELHAILLGADTKFVLHDDPAILDLARQVVHQRLGLGDVAGRGITTPSSTGTRKGSGEFQEPHRIARRR
jgi:AcrR family transcriptional regulator